MTGEPIGPAPAAPEPPSTSVAFRSDGQSFMMSNCRAAIVVGLAEGETHAVAGCSGNPGELIALVLASVAMLRARGIHNAIELVSNALATMKMTKRVPRPDEIDPRAN